MDGLLFDMGDVLYDATGWRRWLWKQLVRMGYPFHYTNFWHTWDEQFLSAVHRGERLWQTAFDEFLKQQGLPSGAVQEINCASHYQKQRLESQTKPLLGVIETLEVLHRRGLKLGVLTDSESSATAVGERLERMGLGGLFLSIVSSRDLQQTKPAPACYLAALNELHLSIEQTAFVGHDWDELQGAAQLGLCTIAFNAPPQIPADYHLRRFADLLQVSQQPTTITTYYKKSA